ncbi:hypothetical protein [Lachnotalea glycerini]|nr:hypothetical protein [Lachnotalea glycerini]
MTPLELRHDLASELETILNHMNFKNQEGNDCKLNIMEQNLPVQMDDDDTDPYPYLLVRLMDGEMSEEEITQSVSINLIIGIYSDDTNAQGADFVLNVIQDIICRFRKCPILNKKYVLNQKLKWALQTDDTYPYYFGGMELNWQAPNIQREGIYS